MKYDDQWLEASASTSKRRRFHREPIMSERQQMEKIAQLADLKVQLQMAAMEAAVAKAEAEKVIAQYDSIPTAYHYFTPNSIERLNCYR
ncbi:unnamed protein product [Haemonchus placei]|uniref:GAGA-binding transcriptional activator n=1 Tax=Haemonchus placei TaxID=6290 RepID=A0A0N4WCF2_HAEPC|nr:unnamed protein product [Haemonchus placei]